MVSCGCMELFILPERERLNVTILVRALLVSDNRVQALGAHQWLPGVTVPRHCQVSTGPIHYKLPVED